MTYNAFSMMENTLSNFGITIESSGSERDQACQILMRNGFGRYFLSDEVPTEERKDEIAELSRRIKRFNPDLLTGDVWLELARVSFILGNLDTSREELKKAIEKTSPNDQAHRIALNCKAYLCTQLGRFREAASSIREYAALFETPLITE